MVDMTEDDIELQHCPEDGHLGARVPAFNIPKGQIEEWAHGGRISNGKMIQQHTGQKEARLQASLDKQAYVARKKGDISGAIEAKKELKAKQNESKKV
jgi:hypothetical protein